MKQQLHLFFHGIFFVLLLLQPQLAHSAVCNPDDESGLLAFKKGITADPTGILASWKSGTDCCTWNGITCSANRVTSVYLSGIAGNSSSYLAGKISPSLSKLQKLDGFYLLNLKNISGPFPDFVLRLKNFNYLYLENNKLSGPLPAAVGNMKQLFALSVAGNRFSGPIPSSLSGLTELGQLKLGNNFFTGSIPVGIRNLVNLTYLSLQYNHLSGPIPDIFGSLSDLLFLELSGNNFTGNLPPSIATLAPKLRFLEVGRNALSGAIPDFLGKFTALDTLNLARNKFTGTVPKSFANLTKIFNLDLSHNRLVDPFPALKVKGIESLDLSYNKFHLGTIPAWVTSSPIIYSLKLARCGITMRLDDWKPKQTYFYDYIDLTENYITGSPVSLLNQTDYLVGFWAPGNKLKFSLEKLRIVDTLQQLDVSRNQVTGKVTTALSGLKKLNVSHNHLCGPIPATVKFPASSFVGNDCLCGSPLAPCKKS